MPPTPPTILQARYQNRNVAGYEATHGSGLDWAAIDRTGTRATAESEVNFQAVGDTITYNYTQMMDRLISVRPMSLTGGVLQWHEHNDRVERRRDHAALSAGAGVHNAAASDHADTRRSLFTDDLPARTQPVPSTTGFNPVRGH